MVYSHCTYFYRTCPVKSMENFPYVLRKVYALCNTASPSGSVCRHILRWSRLLQYSWHVFPVRWSWMKPLCPLGNATGVFDARWLLYVPWES